MNHITRARPVERSHRFTSHMSPAEREALRLELTLAVEEFLRNDGKITVLPIDHYQGNGRGIEISSKTPFSETFL